MRKGILFIVAALSSVYIIGCGGGSLSVDESYSVLRPVKQLELPEQVSDNMVVTINNVADQGSSYKNYVEVYVNDRLIRPNWLVSNVQSNYIYKLRLRPGYYDVKAYYFAYVGWGEEKFEINSQELVRVVHDKRTIVTCDIVKQPNGVPVDNKIYLKTETENLDLAGGPAIVPKKTANVIQRPAPVRRPVIIDRSAPVERPPVPRERRPREPDTIVLQVNTMPINANVTIDDRMVGKAPIRIPVDRNVDHTVQISTDGYKSAVKFLDHSIFGDQKTIHIIQELERIN